ncbi:hypothetical protein WMY93_011296 [Mugilogobius chulae]|uniref:L1 transposable element RRM domain-containing protein n=1 Tax=Mugilogobius chulae TaxID=88201 RepID=A0AAW0N025_9GOBI
MPKTLSKRTREQLSSSELDENAAFTSADREMLQGIAQQLKKLDILDELKADVADLKQSVEFNNAQIREMEKEQGLLKEQVVGLSLVTTSLKNENEKLKAAVLELRCRSMRDNLLIMGIDETKGETYSAAETLVRTFLREQLGFTEEASKKIQMERAHRLGQRKEPGKPRPMIVKFTSSKSKDEILSLSKKLKGTRFFMTNQYPGEVVEKRRKLIPIMNSFREKGQKVRLVTDKLYVNGELYRRDEQ